MKRIFSLFVFFSLILTSGFSVAQVSTLVHYWSFNNLNATYHNPNIPAIHASYSLLDTNKANVVYTLAGGTSPTYAGYIDNVAGDTMNVQFSTIAGQALRVRNPSDSMELRVYAPTTGYHGDIAISYEVQSSSAASGQLAQLFDYSIDSGVTWKTSGLNITIDSVNQAPFVGSWGLISVNFNNDTTTRNNPGFVFRIKFAGNTSLTSGNNRFDNMTLSSIVDTTTVPPPPPPPTDTFLLIHYWHFNNLDTAYHNPNIPALHASYSAIDTNTAKITYVLAPGTAANYAGYIDNVNGGTLNQQMNAGSGQGLRVRNPSDSMELRVYSPTTGYKGKILLKYAAQLSSIGSGQLAQLYDYSTDSGLTWKTTGLNMTIDSMTQAQFQGALWGLVSLNFDNDSTVSDNPEFVFRIKFAGNTSLTTGNNRFDNITVEATLPPADTTTNPTGLNVVKNDQTFTLYPNPANNAIHIVAPAHSNTGNVVTFYNTYGQRVYSLTTKEEDIDVNISHLVPGVYYVALNQGSRTFIKTFIKQ